MERQWVIQRTNPEYRDYLCKVAGISPALSQVLINRGIKTPEAVKNFLGAGASALGNPMDSKGVPEAAEIIKKAAASGKPVLVHGDYDVDGVASTSIMVGALKAIGASPVYFIPNRFVHGYGFHKDCIELAIQHGAGLVVTTDCGITGFETAGLAKEKGLPVVITDHHEPERGPTGCPLLPPADAVVNPKLTAGETELSGTGVAFKLAQALMGDDALQFLDIAALGTVADLVPLVAENRSIVKAGMELIESAGRPAIKALIEIAGASGKDITARLMSFSLVPRLNAPGRLESASEVVAFLLCSNESEAFERASRLDRLNKERQRLEENTFQDAIKKLEHLAGSAAPDSIVVAGEGWHKGVLGIVASRLAEKYGRPAIVLSIDGDYARGSGRSVPGFDLYGGLCALKEMLAGFGGHRQAAGLRISTGRIDGFREAFSSLAAASISEYRPVLKIDSDITLKEVNFGLVKETALLEPFGFGNPEPLFGAKELEVLSMKVVGNGHLKLRLRQGKSHLSYDAIGFDMAGSAPAIEDCLLVDAAFFPMANQWEGRKTLQLNLKGIRPAV
ncbi:MAG: single-stranded-DNA-specific exonuclease RecJ [Actinomycetota bacterium]|nr:single-stranded-DNA-specific exonuclease RecJ [Actinomycetota bacterium]